MKSRSEWKTQKRFQQILTSLLALATFFASEGWGAQSVTIQGRLLNADGTAITSSSVSFTVQVKSPGAEDCLLYQETQTLNLSQTQGAFALTVGAGTRSPSSVDGGNALNKIFSNSMSLPLTSAVGACANAATSYLPTSTDTRKILISFDDGNGVDTIPAIPLAWVPQAIYAQDSGQLGGVNASQFLSTVVGTTPTTFSALEYSSLVSLVNGTNTQYLRTPAGDAATIPVLSAQPTTLAAGKMWYEGGALKYYDANSSTIKTLGTGTGSGTITSVVAGTGLTGGATTGAATLNVDVGTAAGKIVQVQTGGKLPVLDGSNLTALDAAQISTGLLPISRGGTGAATTNAALNYLLPTQTSNAGKLLQTDGTSTSWVAAGVSSVTSANSYLSVATSTTTPVITANVGTAVNTLAAGNDSRIANAVQSAAYANDVALAALCTVSQTPYWNTVSDAWACQSISSSSAGGFFKDGGNSLGAAASIGTNDGFDFIIKTNNATRMTVLSGGNVGIGTTSPAATLSVSGTSEQLRFGYDSSNFTSMLVNSTGTLTVGTNGSTGNMTFNLPSVSSSWSWTMGGFGRMALSNSALYPTAGLDIGSSGSRWQTVYSNLVNAGGAGSNYFSGSVGIGTSSPVSKLHVASAPTATANYGLLSLGSGAFDGATAGFFAGSSSGTVSAMNAASGFAGNLVDYQVAGVSKFKVDASGNVTSAGTTTLSGTTTTSGNFSQTGSSTFSSGTGAVSLNGPTTVAANQNFILASGTGTFSQTYTGTSTASALVANGLTSGSIMSLTSTSTAAAAGNTGLSIAISGANSTSGITRTGLSSAVTATGTSSTNVGGYFSASGGTNNYGLIVGNGNVGIGTTTPGARLHVAGEITSPDSGSSSERFGLGAVATASNSVAFGNTAQATYTGGIAIGKNSTATADVPTGDPIAPIAIGLSATANAGRGAISLGSASSASGQHSISIGGGVSTSATNGISIGAFITNPNTSIVMGRGATSTGGNQFVLGGNPGGNNMVIRDFFFGSPGGSSSPSSSVSINASSGSGTNVTGSDLTLVGGRGTGSANGGKLLFQTTAPGSAGSSQNTPATRMVIDSTGNVGIGTTSPGNLLEVRQDLNGETGIILKNRATVSSGTRQSISFQGYRDVSQSHMVAQIAAIHGAGSAGDLNHSGSLAFLTSTDGQNTPNEKMRVTNTGNVGIGTTTPTNKLSIEGSGSGFPVSSIASVKNTDVTGGARFSAINSSGNGAYFNMYGASFGAPSLAGKAGFGSDTGIRIFADANLTSGGADDIELSAGGYNNVALTVKPSGNVGIGTTGPSTRLHVVGSSGATIATFADGGATTCTVTPASTGFACSSDERLKMNIEPVADLDSLEKILQLRAVTYDWRQIANGRHTGFLAQEIEKVGPEFVRTGEDGFKQVNYTGLIPWITGAIKALYQSKADKSEIAQLRAENAALKSRLDAIEQRLRSPASQTPPQ